MELLNLYYVQWSITHQTSHLALLYPQRMADRTIIRDGGVEDGQVFHPLIMSPRQAKRPVGRTVEMYLDVLSKITDFYLNNSLTESVSTIAPPHASDGFKTDSVSFLPHNYCLLLLRPVHEDV